MRFDPTPKEKLLKKNDPRKFDKITRQVAIAVALIGVYVFFFKLLFF